MKKIIFFLLIFNLSVIRTYSQNSWFMQYFGSEIRTVYFTSPGTGYIGTLIGILKTTNSGINWIPLNSPFGPYSIKFTSEMTGYCCGNSICKTTDGGNNWIQQNSGSAGGYKLCFLNTNTGWCMGDHNIYKTTNGGNNWNNIFYNSTYYLNDFCFSDENMGWCAVTYPTGLILKTTNSGYNWFELNVPGSSQNGYIYFLNNTTGFCGDWSGKVFKTTDGGNYWGLKYSILSGIYSGFFIDSTTGWIGTSNGKIINTTNGGDNWNLQYTLPDFTEAMYFLNPSTGYAGGGNGIIYKTTDGGSNWSELNQGKGDYFSNFSSSYFLNSNTGWMATGNMGVLKTTNGGNNWTFNFTNVKYSLYGLTFSLYGITFLNQNTGFVVGNGQIQPPGTNFAVIFRTSNGGINWNTQSETYNSWGLYCVNFANDNTGWAVGSSGLIKKTTDNGMNWFSQNSNTTMAIRCLKFVNPDTGFCTSNSGYILKTMNGGENWNIQNIGETANLNSIVLVNTNTGWIAGNQGLITKTTNMGSNWIQQTTGVNNDLYSIFFINENTGWSCGQGIILKTVNSGITWKKDLEINPTTLNTIYFVDQYTGWCAGGELMIKTITGGLSWISHDNKIIPKQYSLSQNYPNPFNPSTKIRFEFPLNKGGLKGVVTLKVYDILGKEVQTLVNEQLQPGSYEVTFDGSNLPSGVYFYQLRAGDFIETKKMLIIK